MNGWSAGRVAFAAGARLVAGDEGRSGAAGAAIDSRAAAGRLFVGLAGARADGGEYAPAALAGGAWGVLVSERHAAAAAAAASPGVPVLAASDPLAALQALARERRRDLGCPVVGVTGSTGKTSTKDILASLLAPHLAVHANRENLNTEIGLPLSILDAPDGAQALVLEMAMRGTGQIAELVEIAEPDVGVIVNVGPVHLELLGTVERVAAAKAELIRDLEPGASCVVPAAEPLLDAHLRDDLDTVTFGEAGDVRLASFEDGEATVWARGERLVLRPGFSEPHNLENMLAAVGAALCLGVRPEGEVDVRFSSLRGEVVELPGGVTVVNDCYNANPMSMRAALDHLAGSAAERRVAVLGEMAELGPDAERFHREIGAHAQELGIDLLVAVGEGALPIAEAFGGETYPVAGPEEAGALLQEIAEPGDRVLVKGSRSAGLERVLA
ncbi:MAG TPA: UDP-N-acetylmuramoyl-tripeptide--D-alanyl-D-alanine ligase [Thermoleophilaceae bacterium]|nr:UDP-N-acetylmuramoyl-tripeptide--D-alanyl-D-alanine ligase [Thermoleophilaceae bacterium]